MDICIPTMRPYSDIEQQVQDIHSTAPRNRVVASCQLGSAAQNRNLCLDWARGDIIVMVDDDITDYWDGWLDVLVRPLYNDPKICMVSARLMNTDGTIGPMCIGGQLKQLAPDVMEIKPKKDCVIPSACVAFRNLGFRFDENFRGSGWEDCDFAFQYRKRDKTFKFVVNNACRMTHLNEMKNQFDGNFERNHAYFRSKWSGVFQ